MEIHFHANSKRILLTILGLIPMVSTFSQIPSDESVYESILDTLVKIKEFEFYHSKLELVFKTTGFLFLGFLSFNPTQ